MDNKGPVGRCIDSFQYIHDQEAWNKNYEMQIKDSVVVIKALRQLLCLYKTEENDSWIENYLETNQTIEFKFSVNFYCRFYIPD